MHSAIFTVVLLVSVIHLSADESALSQPKGKPFGICSDDISAPPLPKDVVDALRTSPAVTLISLDPDGGEQPSDPNTFHGWRVLGQTEITVAYDRKAVATAIETAVSISKGLGFACFLPHHGIRVVNGGQTYEFVICFTCGHMHIHTTGQEDRTSRVTGKGEVLNKLLSAAKVPLGKPLKQ